MASTFLNLSIDTTLGGNSASDTIVASQKAIKSYVDSHSGGGGGTTYTAGDGIIIENNEISVDGTTTSEIDTVTTSEVTLATVATSGSYNDLSDKPTIPTTTSSVTSGSTSALTSGGAYTALSEKQDVISSSNKLSASLVSGLATVATTGAFSDLTGTSGLQTTSNLVTSVSSSSTDSQYPSAKLFYDTVGDIETLLAAI